MTKRSSVEEMLERQGRLWELRERMKRELTGKVSDAVAPHQGPWLTLSRQLGSGGSELARRLAHELGWQAYDREILQMIAEQTHSREAVLRRLDEQALGPINDFLGTVLDPKIPGRVPFLQEMVHVIWGLARQGHTIIVGRGANWLLGSEHGYRVRIVAPLDVRIDRYTRAQGLARKAAEHDVRTHDESQRQFIRQVYGQDIDDPSGYDRIIDTAITPLHEAERAILNELEARALRD